MKWFKLLLRLFLKQIHPDLEYKFTEQFHFNQLHRRSPEFLWKILSPGPVARLDVAGIRVRHELFLFGGAQLGGKAINALDVFDLQKERWLSSLPIPSNLAQTHQG